MESIIRTVKDINAEERRCLESALGRQLKENQRIIIQVIDVGLEPNEDVRRQAHREASEIARKGRANAAAQGVTEEEVDAAIDEAIAHVRRHAT